MVDPKKEYELLMRYLQGGEDHHRPRTEPSFVDTWTSAPEIATPPLPPQETKPAVATTQPQLVRKPLAVRNAASFRKKAHLIIAFLAAVLLLALLWNAYYLYQLSGDAIFKKLYVPFTTAPAKNTNSQPGIEQYYAAGNFVATTMLSKKQQRLSDREQLLAGLAYLHRADYIKAIKWLEPLSNNFKSPYRQQAEYYLALTYLKNEDYDRCILKLEQMRNTPSHLFHDRISNATIGDIKMLKWK